MRLVTDTRGYGWLSGELQEAGCAKQAMAALPPFDARMLDGRHVLPWSEQSRTSTEKAPPRASSIPGWSRDRPPKAARRGSRPALPAAIGWPVAGLVASGEEQQVHPRGQPSSPTPETMPDFCAEYTLE